MNLLLLHHLTRPYEPTNDHQRRLDNNKAALAHEEARETDRQVCKEDLVATRVAIQCSQHVEELKKQYSQQLEEACRKAKDELDAKMRKEAQKCVFRL